MKKYEITFYFDQYSFITMIGFYDKMEDLIKLVHKCANRAYPYFIDKNSTNGIGVNINKVRYFRIRELGGDSNGLY